jgi:hypothetical protein
MGYEPGGKQKQRAEEPLTEDQVAALRKMLGIADAERDNDKTEPVELDDDKLRELWRGNLRDVLDRGTPEYGRALDLVLSALPAFRGTMAQQNENDRDEPISMAGRYRPQDNAPRSDAAAADMLADSWRAWHNDGTAADTLTRVRLLAELPLAQGSIEAIERGLRRAVTTAWPSLAEAASLRVATLAGVEDKGWDPRALAILERLAYMYDSLRTAADGQQARLAATAWLQLRQHDDESWAAFTARGRHLRAVAGYRADAEASEWLGRARPDVRSTLAKEIEKVMDELERAGNEEAAAQRKQAALDGRAITVDRLLGAHDVSLELWHQLATRATRRADDHREQQAENDDVHEIDAIGTKNANIICAHCGKKGHPFRLCRTATEADKKALTEKIYKKAAEAKSDAKKALRCYHCQGEHPVRRCDAATPEQKQAWADKIKAGVGNAK